MRSLFSLLAIVTATSAVLCAEDWPKWRGPRGDGISRETLADSWPKTGPKKVWSAKVGAGYASPIAREGVVYVFAVEDAKDVLTAFKADDGKELWKQTNENGYTGAYAGTRATPVIDDKFIYTCGGNGILVCRDLADGKMVWNIDVLATTSAQNHTWGVSSSPLIDGNLLYVQSGIGGAAALAVNKKDGKTVWKSQARDGGYAHPILIDVGEKKQLICFANHGVVAMDPTKGTTIWTEPWETDWGVNSTTPIYRDGKLFITSAYNHGCMMLEPGEKSAKKLWQNKNVLGKFPAPILDGDLLFAVSDEKRGVLKCLSWPSCDVKWEVKPSELTMGSGGSIVRAGDKIIALSEAGVLTLIKATADKYSVITQGKLFEDSREIWATPLIYNGKLYAKGPSEIVCLEVGK